MTNTLLKLQKKIPDNLRVILLEIFTVTDKLNIQTFVVGATARDLIIEYVYEAKIYRATEDIDFGVAVGNWNVYENLKRTLTETGKFEIDQNIEQRIWWKDGGKMKVDLVPYGGLESKPGEIAFPPKGDSVMNTNGFAEAFADSLFLDLENNLIIRVVSLAGLAMLKFVAYNDRPNQRKRDLQDIFFIAENYMLANNEGRLFDENASDADLLLNEDFNYETCGARLLGRDIAKLLNAESQKIVLKTLMEEKAGGRLQIFADAIYSQGLRDENRYTKILEVLGQLRIGINDRL